MYLNSLRFKEHRLHIKEICQDLDLLKETEFHLFKNEDFASQCVNSCLDMCSHVSKKLHIKIYFAVKFDLTFNARAIVKANSGIILLNVGLIDKLELIVSDSVRLFLLETVAQLTITPKEKLELKTLLNDLCLTYLVYHEVAHVIQLTNTFCSETYNLQEQYSDNELFNMKNHAYELDADLFGVSMSTYKLLEYLNFGHPINPISLFNLLTILSLSISNIIILFSNDKFETIYYKDYSHPHPLIRMIKCNDQILSSASNNTTVSEELFIATLQRTISIIDQLNYTNKGKINYSKLYENNMTQIESYIDEIEVANDSFSELTRFHAQEIFNKLYY